MVDRMVAHVKQSDKAKAAALPRFDELCPPFRYVTRSTDNKHLMQTLVGVGHHQVP
jgi:hypothetical protein